MTRKSSEPEKAGSGIPQSPAAFAVEHAPRTDFVVFGVTAAITVFFVCWGVFSTESLARMSSAALSWLVTNIGWGFVLAATGFVVFALWLAISRYGAIPLGQDD